MARTKKRKEENIAASTNIADKSSRIRTERKIKNIIDYLIRRGQFDIVSEILANPKIEKFLGKKTVNEYHNKIDQNDKIDEIEQFSITFEKEMDEDLRKIIKGLRNPTYKRRFLKDEKENLTNISQQLAKRQRKETDYSNVEIRRKKLKEFQYPIVLLDSEIIHYVEPTELVKMFSFYPEIEKQFKQIDYEENPMFSHEIRQLIAFCGDEFTPEDLLVAANEEENGYRTNNIQTMALLLNKIFENFEQTGKLERLVNDENQRNKTINFLMPDELQIVANPQSLFDELARIKNNIGSDTLTNEDKVELAALLRTFLNKSAHEQEFCLMTILREKYKAGEPFAAQDLRNQSVSLVSNLFHCLETGKRMDDKSTGKQPPIDFELLISEGDKGKETIRLEKIVESVLRNGNLFKKVDKDLRKAIVANIKERINSQKEKNPDIKPKVIACIGFAEIMHPTLEELHEQEISEKIEKCVIKVSELERRYAKITSKSSFYEFIKEYLGAKNNNNNKFEENLRGTRKSKIYKEVDELFEQLRNDPNLDEAEVGGLLEEMARHAKMDREVFEAKQLITRQLIVLEELLHRQGIQSELYIEHNTGKGIGTKKTKEDRNVIDIYIPRFSNLFGGHYENGEFTESEVEYFQSRYKSTSESRRRAYEEHTEDYAAFAPVKLSEEQVMYLQKIARAVETIDATGKSPDDYEVENIEEYAAYDLEKAEETINVYAELYYLKQTNPTEYEKVRHQILLGAGLDTFRNMAAREREAEKIAKEAEAEAKKAAEIQRQQEEREKAREEEKAQAESLAEDDEISSEVLIGRPEIRPGVSEARRFSMAVRSGEVADIETFLQADHTIEPKEDVHSTADDEGYGEGH